MPNGPPGSPVAGLLEVPGLSELTVIARGGSSTVYRAVYQPQHDAQHNPIAHPVAVKLASRSLDDNYLRRRFFREARAIRRVSGRAHIVPVHDIGMTNDNHPYLVMELCTGGSYADRLARHGPLSPDEVQDMGVKIAEALEAAHRAGVLHCDVKPANILLTADGVPGLTDFGLAALRGALGDLLVANEALTPAYAPPEAFRLERPRPTRDVFSLAATLSTLLTGVRPHRSPWSAPGFLAPASLLSDSAPDIPAVPASLGTVLRQAMAADPAARYPTAGAFAAALAAA